METSGLERVLRHDRFLIGGAMGVLTLGSWISMATPGRGPDGLMPCCGARFDVAFAMWVVMMAGMMIPSAAPMVLTHAAIVRRRARAGAPFASSSLLLGGYLLAWTGFSAVAALAQRLLFLSGRLDGHTLSIGRWGGAAVLVAAAIFQLSPAKEACLARCRAPVGYFITEWREGTAGALLMGLRHGLSCIGCCWLLMAVLFAVGIMNLWWSALITALVIAEKVLPWPRLVVWSGTAMCVAGALFLIVRGGR